MIDKLKDQYRVVRRLYRNRIKEQKLTKGKKLITNFHASYRNKRCFILGNGPSLTVDDLEKLKGEYCFASHRIYNIFDKTDWRPQFYCVQDANLINRSSKQINEINVPYKFIGVRRECEYKIIESEYWLEMKLCKIYPELPTFSENLAKCFYEGYTVTYMCLQLAAYMGFNEIYLLGVDHSYSIELNPDGTIKHKDVQDHFDENDTIENIPQTFKSSLAYIAANNYAEKNNIRIINCTRGGSLNAFIRMDLDDVINNNIN